MTTRKKAGKPAKKSEPTKVRTVKAKEEDVNVRSAKDEPKPLKKGDAFLFIKNGHEVYLTRTVANVLLQRNSAKLEIPKGSPFVPPKGSNCDGC